MVVVYQYPIEVLKIREIKAVDYVLSVKNGVIQQFTGVSELGRQVLVGHACHGKM